MKCLIVSALAICAAVSLPAFGQEYFGEFSGDPSGRFIEAEPRPLFELSEEFWFSDPNGLEWRVPSGTRVDGASIPPAFWSVIGGPFSGNYLQASVIHDFYCDTKTRTAHDTHRNFYYGMRSRNIPLWQAKLMYWAVATFGPSWIIEKRVETQLNCTTAVDGSAICISVPLVRSVAVDEPQIDLADPATLAVAQSKFASVAKNLQTSKGQILDVTAFGNVDASIVSISQNAALNRAAIVNKEYLNDPDSIGVLAPPKLDKIDQLDPWIHGTVPLYPDIKLLNPEVPVGQLDETGFRFNPSEVDALEDLIDLSPGTYEFPGAPQQ